MQPVQGRLFAPGETDATASRPGLGGPPVAILSSELWQSAFGRQSIVGQRVQVDGRPHDIIGIMPAGFDVMDNRTEIWLPIGVHPADSSGSRQPHSAGDRTSEGGRHRAGGPGRALHVPRELGRARRRGRSCADCASDRVPRITRLRLQPVQDALVGEARRAIWVLQAAAGLVLLIACANLASLVLARAESPVVVSSLFAPRSAPAAAA